jgi:hypothetical protein
MSDVYVCWYVCCMSKSAKVCGGWMPGFLGAWECGLRVEGSCLQLVCLSIGRALH